MLRNTIIVFIIILLVSCGGRPISETEGKSETPAGAGTEEESGVGPDHPAVEGTGLNGAQEVTGQVKTESGTNISGATVYIPGTTEMVTSCEAATRTYTQRLSATDGTTCEDAPALDQPMTAVCTAADGSFIIDTSKLVGNPTQLVIQKGGLCIIIPLSCTQSSCVINATDTTIGSANTSTTWPKVAVVTGNFDRMEDVLAKMADGKYYGRVSTDTGFFVYGSESGTNLTIIDGTGATTSQENGLTYATWDKYMSGIYSLLDSNGNPVFDLIFINCGNVYESSIYTGKTYLQEYVNAGGRLFVTDQAYDFIEQTFPYAMKFEGDSDTATTPGVLDAAQTGSGDIQYDVTVNSSSMTTWLGSSSVNAHNTSSPGNPDTDCNGVKNYTQYSSSLLSNGLLPVGELLEHWTHMVSKHTGYYPTIWISSGSTIMDSLVNRPLTISLDIGNNGGRVVYSSYHTAQSCPTVTFWPQERVMQYLVLDSF